MKMLQNKIRESGIPMSVVLHTVGLKKEETFWEQIRSGKMRVSSMEKLSVLLDLTKDEIREIASEAAEYEEERREAGRAAVKKYAKEQLKRIPLDLRIRDQLPAVQAAAEAQGVGIVTYIKGAIMMRMESEGMAFPDSKPAGIRSDLLIELRGEMSQKEAAGHIGCTVNALQAYESGDRVPRDEMLIRISDFYGVPVKQFII